MAMQRSGRCAAREREGLSRVYCGGGGGGGGGRRGSTPPKVSACRRAGARQAGPMLPPPPLAPLEPHKARALTTIYAPRKPRLRKNRTAQSRDMLESDIPTKQSLSPFHPLPAIGQTKTDKTTKVFVFEGIRPATVDDGPLKARDVKALTPLRIRGFNRKSSLDSVVEKKPQLLLRENTYDVIDPIFVTSPGLKRNEALSRRSLTMILNSEKPTLSPAVNTVTPKSRFKKAALQVGKTGKLLCLREKDMVFCYNEDDKSVCRLENLPECPSAKLTKLTEIFQSLDMKDRHRDKIMKENSWF